MRQAYHLILFLSIAFSSLHCQNQSLGNPQTITQALSTLQINNMSLSDLMRMFNYDSYSSGVDPFFKQECSSTITPQSPSDCTSKSNDKYNCCYGQGTAMGITRQQCFSLTVAQTNTTIKNLTDGLGMVNAQDVLIKCTAGSWVEPLIAVTIILMLMLF